MTTTPILGRVACVQCGAGRAADFYYHLDQLGTPQAMTDANQAVVWRADYEPFGQATVTVQTVVNNPLRLPRQHYDAETGLHYNYFRDYDPMTGRYLQSDPIGLAGGLNTYAYVGSNPLKYADPSGTVAIPLILIPAIQILVDAATVTIAGAALIDGPDDQILLMAKGGRQNIENEYSREARKQPDPCDWLRRQYETARGKRDSVAAKKIQEAQKALGCRNISKDRCE